MSDGPERVYKTRITSAKFGSDVAITLFADPDEAKRYLEAYIEERLDRRTSDWRREESAEEKWSMGIVPSSKRAVVHGMTVHESADEPLAKMREVLEEMWGESA